MSPTQTTAGRVGHTTATKSHRGHDTKLLRKLERERILLVRIQDVANIERVD